MFGSISFWCVIAGLFVAAHLIGPQHPRLRSGALSLLSLAGIVIVFDLTPAQLALLAASIAWVIGALTVIKPNPRGATTRTALLIAAPVLGLWTVGKISTAMTGPLAWLFFIGSSFFVVKAYSLIKDRIEGKVPHLDPVLASAYFLFFPAFLSGPMHTYGEFRDTLANPEPAGANFVDIAFRFVWGLFKVSVLAAICTPASLEVLVKADTLSLPTVLYGALFYSGVLYFNFSGYSDMVIALSRAMGIKTPENFQTPYLSPSIRDFWRRWHITFSRALTAHVFIPVSRALTRALPGQRLAVPAIGYMATFLFAGFWHGAAVNFLLWGAWHAIGLIAQDFAQKLMPRKIGQPVKKNWPLTVLKTAATFAFVTVGWIFFVLPIDQILKIR